MKIGIIVQTKEAEKAWNAFRFGVAALNAGHGVTVFLLGEGVECAGVRDERFNVLEQITGFRDAGGKILACRGALKLRQIEESEICLISGMRDLVKLVEDAEKVLVF